MTMSARLVRLVRWPRWAVRDLSSRAVVHALEGGIAGFSVILVLVTGSTRVGYFKRALQSCSLKNAGCAMLCSRIGNKDVDDNYFYYILWQLAIYIENI